MALRRSLNDLSLTLKDQLDEGEGEGRVFQVVNSVLSEEGRMGLFAML